MTKKKDDTEDLAQPAREASEWEQGSEEAGAKGGAEDSSGLQAALDQKTAEAAAAQERYLRTAADFENYRKRMQRDMADFRKYANEQLAMELLSVVDNLGLALKHASEGAEQGGGLREGVELVYKQFRDALDKFGVKPFKAEGEWFDPAKHDAMMQVESTEVPENTVVQVFQEGYSYHDKVLRHAKVGVSKQPAAGKAGAAD